MSQHKKLKECPFCGSNAVFVCAPKYFDGKYDGYFVKCDKNCCVMAPTFLPNDAVKMWNHRFENVQEA